MSTGGPREHETFAALGSSGCIAALLPRPEMPGEFSDIGHRRHRAPARMPVRFGGPVGAEAFAHVAAVPGWRLYSVRRFTEGEGPGVMMMISLL